MNSDWHKVREIFEEGLDRPQQEREAFLDSACGGDKKLRASVEALLKADGDTTSFMQPPARSAAFSMMSDMFARSTGMDPATQALRIGQYRVENAIASGGMGTVYRAVREDGEYEQHVALKVIKPGMATDDILRRFKQERQTLARLNHPNIARILDGGATEEGGPYLVMEYVDGAPLHSYCRDNNHSLEKRLDIFTDVCEAVHYAHRNLIVHRDIKPGNILVNRDGQVKLLDFGIAKLLDGDDASMTTTDASQRLMTPQYASPEQLTGGDITTVSDVYSLGVVLYELLTGTRPYDLRGKKGDEARRVVCETTPSAPSTAVIRPSPDGLWDDPPSGNSLGTGSTNNGSLHASPATGTTRMALLSPSRLSRRLRGDLDTIVLTALHKDPERRYASVDRLSEDIHRYMKGLPIQARRDSVGYRVGKFIKRHRAAVIAASVMLVSLTVGAVGATWGMVRAQAGEERARVGERQAQVEAQKQRETVQFLQGMLAAAEPLNEPKDITVREILDQSAAMITGATEMAPEVRASIQYTIGTTYDELGMPDEAEVHLREALDLRRDSYGARHPDTIAAMTALADHLNRRGFADEADEALREAELAAAESDWQDERVAVTLYNTRSHLAAGVQDWEQAEQYADLAVEQAENAYGEDHPVTLDTLNNLATVYARQQRFDDALPVYESVLQRAEDRFGSDSARALIYANNLAALLTRQRRLDDARGRYSQVYEKSREVSGANHPRTLAALGSLVNIMISQRNYTEAAPLAEELLDIRRTHLGAHEPQTLEVMVSLASVRLGLGEFKAAEELLQEAVDLSTEHLGPSDPRTWRYQQDLARFHTKVRNWDAARPILTDLYAVQQESLGESHADTLRTGSILGLVHVKTDSYESAVEILEPVVALLAETNGPDSRTTLIQQANLSQALMGMKRYEEAASALEQTIERGESTLGDSWLLPLFRSYYGECQQHLGKPDRAEEILLSAYADMSTLRGETDGRTKQVAALLAGFYEAQGDTDAATEWQAKASGSPTD